jgi:hypothetical protein
MFFAGLPGGHRQTISPQTFQQNRRQLLSRNPGMQPDTLVLGMDRVIVKVWLTCSSRFKRNRAAYLYRTSCHCG